MFVKMHHFELLYVESVVLDSTVGNNKKIHIFSQFCVLLYVPLRSCRFFVHVCL